jgi:hypothetical protein
MIYAKLTTANKTKPVGYFETPHHLIDYIMSKGEILDWVQMDTETQGTFSIKMKRGQKLYTFEQSKH